MKANEEQIRWDQEIRDKERSRRPPKPAKPKFIKGAINERIQRWFIDRSKYKDLEVFLKDTEIGVRKTIDGVKG